MNKIYRKLWSTARQCWVVASELTTTRGKAAPAARLGVPSALALGLLLGASAFDAAATSYLGCDANTGDGITRCVPFASHAQGERNYASGNALRMDWLSLGAGAWADGNRGTAVGTDSRANGDNSSVFGYKALTRDGYASAFGAQALAEGVGASAFGNDAWARGNNSLAFGSGAQTAFGAGTDRIAIGGDAYAGDSGYTGAISVGGKSRSRYDGASFGYAAEARASGSVALGSRSIATEVDTVSVGNGSVKRKIVNVNDGVVSSTSYDAVNGRTLQREKDALNSSIGSVRSTANTALTRSDQALARANTTGYAVATGSAITDATKATATGNVSLAMGHSARSNGVAATAIGNGAKALANNAIAMGSVAEASGTNAMALGGNAKATHNNAVALGERSATTGIDQISVGNATLKRSIVNVKDGTVAAGSSEVVTGNQLHATNTNVSTLTARLNAAAIALGQGAAAEGTGGSGSAAMGAGAKAYNTSSAAFGADARAGVDAAGDKSEATGSLAMGANSRSGNGAVAAGLRASAIGDRGVAVGNDAAANATHSTAIGYKANASSGQATALGRQAAASGMFSTAVGNLSVASGQSSLSMGDRASATHSESVALGFQSQTTGNRQVSVGNTSIKRKIVNMADGQLADGSNEAVTGNQLHATNRNVTTAQNAANAAQTTANSAVAKADALGGLVSQGAANGNVRLGGENTGTTLDMRNKANAARKVTGVADATLNGTSTEAVTGRQLNTTNTNVTTAQNTATAAQTAAGNAQTTANTAVTKANALEGLVAQVAPNGNVRVGGENTGATLDVRNKANANRKVTGVADATLNGTSNEAVTGRQLNTTNTNVTTAQNTATAAQTAAGNAQTTANTAVAKADALGGLVGQVAPNGSVRLGGDNTGATLDVRNKANANRTVTGVADGALRADSSEAVNGKQLFATDQKVKANEGLLANHGSQLVTQSGRIDANRRDLDALRGEFDNFDPDLDGVVKFAADGSVDVAGGKLKGVAAGDISSAGSTDAVNGGQLFATNSRVAKVENDTRYMSVSYGEHSNDARSAEFSVALGDSAEAGGSGSVGATAVGAFARALSNGGVALGRGSFVEQDSENGFALGTGASVRSKNAAAIGGFAQVSVGASHAVALGAESIASEANVVSVGNASLKRRIVNVGRGRGDGDATTVAQLRDAISSLGGDAGIDINGDIVAPTYTVQGGTQNNVGDALAALDSAVVKTGSRVDGLEGKLRSAFQDGPSVRSDGLNQLALNGANGSVLTNLADGWVGAGSRDAVTGNQLFEAKQEIARNRSDLDDLRGERDGLNSRGLMAGEQGGVIDFGGARLTGVADGVVSEESRDVVNGGQLFGTNQRVSDMEAKARLTAFGDEASAIDATAGEFSVAIGNSAKAAPNSEGATAVGSFADASGRNSVALGRAAVVTAAAAGGFALGTGTFVEDINGVAVGSAARVSLGAKGAVAIGANSVATEANTVSLGDDVLKRRLVNVANGRNATDAATVGQLRGALATLGGDVDAYGNIINPTFNVQGGQQSTLNEALSTLDSAVVTNTTRTDRVESQLRSVFQDSPTVRNDGLNQLTFAGANGMVLSNVANGAIAAGSRDAVNGGQLHSLQQQLNGRMDGLEQRVDGQPQAPQSRALTIASADAGAPPAVPAPSPLPEDQGTPMPPAPDNKLADNGTPPPVTPQADAPKPEAPTPQVDTAELEKMLARANEYSDGISREVDRRLDKMDKRFNRMAAMSSAQSAMAMNTAGLNTYNRLGAGVGYSEGESAMAVGYQRVLNDKGSATFSLNGAFTNSGERSMGVGVGIGW